jgi:hypothetical protein
VWNKGGVSGGRTRAGRVWTKGICLNLAKDYAAAAMAEAATALGTGYELDADRARPLRAGISGLERYLVLVGDPLRLNSRWTAPLPACSSRSTINGLGWLGLGSASNGPFLVGLKSADCQISDICAAGSAWLLWN